jgi:hypothetical protein
MAARRNYFWNVFSVGCNYCPTRDPAGAIIFGMSFGGAALFSAKQLVGGS